MHGHLLVTLLINNHIPLCQREKMSTVSFPLSEGKVEIFQRENRLGTACLSIYRSVYIQPSFYIYLASQSLSSFI